MPTGRSRTTTADAFPRATNHFLSETRLVSEVSMRRIVSWPLSALAILWALPTPVWASTSAYSMGARTAGPAEGEDVVVIDDEMEGGETPPAEGTTPPAEGTTPPPAEGGGVEDILGEEKVEAPTAEQAAVTGKQEKNSEEKQIKAEMGLIRVIQRQRMLKKKRFEIQPQVGISINDPYVRHYAFGLDLNYWITNRMAVGLTGTGYVGARTPRYKNIRFQEGLLLTANQLLWSASVNFTYNPFYGKVAIFNRGLLHWEAGLQVGGGALQTRVIPRYEALHDPFTTITGGGQFGLISRFYGRRVDWLSVNAGVRTWIYPDKQEPRNRGPDTGAGGVDLAELDDPDRAKDAADFKVAFNVVFFLGVSFYVPTKFEYTTPR
jgi:outer membrane beta-barrel protein